MGFDYTVITTKDFYFRHAAGYSAAVFPGGRFRQYAARNWPNNSKYYK